MATSLGFEGHIAWAEAMPWLDGRSRVLGGQTYESLAHKGETMTTVAMATHAYDQIDQARTELDAVSK